MSYMNDRIQSFFEVYNITYKVMTVFEKKNRNNNTLARLYI